MPNRNLATVFGGSGFIGHYVVQRLARKGFIVHVAVREPASALFLKTSGAVGQIVPLAGPVTNDADVNRCVEGAEVVINLVGILAERRKAPSSTFMSRARGVLRGSPRPTASPVWCICPPSAPVPTARAAMATPRQRAKRQCATHSRRDHPPPLHRLRAGGPFLQSLRPDRPDLSCHARDRRRDEVPARLCWRRGGRCDGEPRPHRHRGNALRTWRPTRLDLP